MPIQSVGVVVAQDPERGRLSSYDEVRLVVAQPVHGVVPDVTGLTLREARTKLARAGLATDVAGFTDGRPGRVVAQTPTPRVAARPGLSVSLVVARG